MCLFAILEPKKSPLHPEKSEHKGKAARLPLPLKLSNTQTTKELYGSHGRLNMY